MLVVLCDGRAVDELRDHIHAPHGSRGAEAPLPRQDRALLDRTLAAAGLDRRSQLGQGVDEAVPLVGRRVDHDVEIVRHDVVASECPRHGPDDDEPAAAPGQGSEYLVEHENRSCHLSPGSRDMHRTTSRRSDRVMASATPRPAEPPGSSRLSGFGREQYHAAMLVGRGREQAVLQQWSHRVARGAGGSLVLAGDAGMGKSALLAELADGWPGTALMAGGRIGVIAPPFAALHDLLVPHAGWLSALRPRRAAALAGALALGPPVSDDPLALAEVTLDLLRLVAEQQPVLVIVDDAEGVDPSSRQVLDHLATRLADDAIGVLFAVRPPIEVGLVQLPRLDFGPLDAVSSRAILRAAPWTLARHVEEALLDLGEGSPLVLTTLPGLLDDAQRDGRAPIDPFELGAERRVFSGIPHEIGALGSDAVVVLSLVAIADRTSLPTIEHAAALLDLSASVRSVLTAAVEAGIVVVDHEIGFAHPLTRAAVLGLVGTDGVRRAHAALGAVRHGPSGVWHRAEAAVLPDEQLAAELDEAVAEAAARRDLASMVKFARRAAALSTEPDDAARRLIAAGDAATTWGDAVEARALFERAASTAVDPVRRATARRKAGLVAMWHADARRGHRMLVRAAEEARPFDLDLAARALADAALAATAWDCRVALEVATEASTLCEAGLEATRVVVGAAHAWCLTLRGRPLDALQRLTAIEPLFSAIDPSSPDAVSLLFALNVHLQAGHHDLVRAVCESTITQGVDAQAIGMQAAPTLLLADLDARTGCWQGLDVRFAAGLEMAARAHQAGPCAIGELFWARNLAERGEAGPCREAIARAEIIARTIGMDSVIAFATHALARLELGLGDAAAARDRLLAFEPAADRLGLEDSVFLPWRPDLVEALVRTGDVDAARRVTEDLRRSTSAGPSAALAALARCEGMTSDDPDTHFGRALEHHADAAMPFETARTELAFGQILRRARRRGPARTHLERALATFDRLGARPWSTQTATELALLDGHTGSGDPLVTPQQLRIAAEVSAGARNREIAERLFLSEKTVERHLHTLYRTLGIRTRTDLAMWFRARDAIESAG